MLVNTQGKETQVNASTTPGNEHSKIKWLKAEKRAFIKPSNREIMEVGREIDDLVPRMLDTRKDDLGKEEKKRTARRTRIKSKEKRGREGMKAAESKMLAKQEGKKRKKCGTR